jgi:hypothetical protein
MAPAADDPQAPPSGAVGAAGAALGGAALLSSWNPFAAPVGLFLGLAAAGLGLWALRRRRGGRTTAAVALAAGALAAVVSGLVLGLSAGAVTAELPGEPVVVGRSAAQASELLEAARAASAPARARARAQLEEVGAAGAAAGESAKDDAPLEPAPPEGTPDPGDETE